MSNYNSTLQSNNTDLQEVLQILQNKAANGGGEQATPVISVDNSNGVITATAGTKSSTHQLTVQPAKTITPSTEPQTAVASGVYTTGEVTIGAIPNTYVKPTATKGATTYTPSTSNQTIASGTYLTGTQTIKGDSNLKAENIKSGVTIFNVTGTAPSGGGTDTSDATATADEIFAGETAYGASGKVTGTFTIDAELAAQNSLIPQIRNALKGKAFPPSNPSALSNEVNFYDYDGTILYSYTVEEAQALTELPPLPTQPGLICQGWNYDLETIKSYNRSVNVGTTYITDDGKTRLYIKIAAEGRMNVPLYFTQTVSNGVTIDWGDDSTTQTLSGTGKVNTTHTYTNIGDYVITLDVTTGCTLGLGHLSSNSFVHSYCILGATGTAGKVYCNMLQRVEIGNGITSISNDAFYSCHSLASITIPNSVTSIGNYVFYDCYSLANIIIPNNITIIGNSAFNGCHSLASITIPNSVTSIGASAFMSCYSLASITIPNSVTIIVGNTFFDCHSLTSIIIPDNITIIDRAAFESCSSLTSIIIPDGVTSIGEYAFYECYSLASITIPNSVTSIGASAFRDCYSLTSIIIPDGVTIIDTDTFDKCYSLASITIPNSVTSIDNYAFSNCYGMAIYDFTSHTSIPTLSSTNTFTSIPSDCIIKVPAALYDKWKVATNWSTYASQIVAV